MHYIRKIEAVYWKQIVKIAGFKVWCDDVCQDFQGFFR